MAARRIISLELSTTGIMDSFFRIQTESGVKYITVAAGALDAKSLWDMPLEFQTILPPLPYSEASWNFAYILKNMGSGQLEAQVSQKALPGVQKVWHHEKVKFLDLQRNSQLTLLAQECSWAKESSVNNHNPITMVAKIARFNWEIQYIEAETRIYRHLKTTRIAPSFLGHIHEDGRVNGFLLEKLEGRNAGISDLQGCQEVLSRLHGLGILHGDVNRYNFIIDKSGATFLIDFEKSKLNADKAAMEKEMASLEKELSDESGLGGGFQNFQ